MDYTNTEVVLTVQDRGAQALSGAYEFVQDKNEKTGALLWDFFKPKEGVVEKIPCGKLVTTKLPVDHKCSVRVILNNNFVLHAISDDSKPKRMSAGLWRNLSKANRLKFHIKKYVTDMFGENEFTYDILE